MGHSEMRESDFSDSDSDVNEADTESCNSSEKIISGHVLMEDQMDDLVKFVTVGSPIVKTKGLVLYRPTAIIPSFMSHSEKPGEIDRKTRKVPNITL